MALKPEDFGFTSQNFPTQDYFSNPIFFGENAKVPQFAQDFYEREEIRARAPKGVNVSTRSANAIRQAAFGYSRISGTITFLTADEGESGQFLHVLVTFTTHEIEGIEKLFLDGREVTFASGVSGWATGDWANLVFASVQNGATTQSSNSHLLSQSEALFPGKWTSAHTQSGCSGLYLILKYDQLMFQNGFPEISVEGYWNSQIYDPRDDSTGWSDNAALIIAHCLTNTHYGIGFGWDKIDLDNLSWAANICDQTVETNVGGSTEKRYTINGAFEVSRGYDHQKVINDFRAAIAGSVSWDGQQIKINPGTWLDSVMDLSEDDLRSPLSITLKPSKSEIYNAIKGQHLSFQSNYQLTDFPVVTNSFYEEQDGERIFYELELPYTTSHYAAQRISKIALEQRRQWISFSASFSMRAYPLEVNDVVTFTSERLGWEEKEFKIALKVDKPQQDGSFLVELTLIETASEIYDWNYGEQTEVDIAPNTNLPNPANLPIAANLTLESGTEVLDIRSDGTVFARIKVSWDETTDPFVLTGGVWEIQYKKSSSSSWLSSHPADGTHSHAFILDVQDGVLYDVRVRAVTLFKGQWVTEYGHFVVGKTENPSTPTNFEIQILETGIFLSWDAVTDLDIAGYEIRTGSWGSGTRIFRAAATSFLWQAQSSGNYTFVLRAFDTSGNYSNEIVETLDVIAPGKVQGLNGVAIYNMVMLDWNEPNEGTFPVQSYNIYKGASFGSAVNIGNVSATIKTFFEQVKGTYTYWVTALDVYGNEGEESRIVLNVDSAPLFVLLADVMLDPADADTLTNIAVENRSLVCPVNNSETYSEHFTDNSWSTPEDQVNAGYPLYIQPAVTSDAVFEYVHDYGSVLAGALFSFTYLAEWADGDGDIAIRLGYSSDGTTWTYVNDTTQIWAEDFRYVYIKLTISGDDDTSVVRISYPRIRIDVKTTSESGLTECVSSDSTGTKVTFVQTFLDIDEDSFKPTFKGSSAYFPSFRIDGNDVYLFLWNTSGARVSGTVSWSISGVVAN